MTTNTKPIDTIRISNISAAIWANTGAEGKIFYRFTMERSYSDKDGNIQSTSSFNLQDALTLAKVADLAHTRIYELLKSDKTESVDAEAEAN